MLVAWPASRSVLADLSGMSIVRTVSWVDTRVSDLGDPESIPSLSSIDNIGMR